MKSNPVVSLALSSALLLRTTEDTLVTREAKIYLRFEYPVLLFMRNFETFREEIGKFRDILTTEGGTESVKLASDLALKCTTEWSNSSKKYLLRNSRCVSSTISNSKSLNGS